MGGQSKNAGNQENLANTSAGGSSTTGQNLLSSVFGSNGQGGNISAMANPNSLNVSQPTGPYALQYNQAKAQGATNLAQANQNVDMQAGNAGFGAGAPSGYTGFLKSQNALQNAGNNGNLFSQYAGQSYQDALNNFWKANDLTASTGNTQTGQANSAYTSLYGSTPKATGVQNALGTIGSGISAGGQVGAAALTCVCDDTWILMPDFGSTKVQDLAPGDAVATQMDEKNIVQRIEKVDEVECSEIRLASGMTLTASNSHTLVLAMGGYTRVREAMGKTVRTVRGFSRVVAIIPAGKRPVYQIFLDGSHDYCSDGLWSLE